MQSNKGLGPLFEAEAIEFRIRYTQGARFDLCCGKEHTIIQPLAP